MRLVNSRFGIEKELSKQLYKLLYISTAEDRCTELRNIIFGKTFSQTIFINVATKKSGLESEETKKNK